MLNYCAEAGRNPQWNQKFNFKVRCPLENNLIQHKLVLRVMDRDTFSVDDFVGEAT